MATIPQKQCCVFLIASQQQMFLFSCLAVSDSLQPHGLQHPRFPCLSGFTISRSLLKLMSIELVMPSNHLILCCPFLPLPSIFPNIRVFSSGSVLCIRWPNSWSFSISPFSEYSGLISFRIDWFDLLAVQGTLRSLLQHHNQPFCSIQAFKLLDEAHSHQGGHSALFSLLIQMLISSRNILTDSKNSI